MLQELFETLRHATVERKAFRRFRRLNLSATVSPAAPMKKETPNCVFGLTDSAEFRSLDRHARAAMVQKLV